MIYSSSRLTTNASYPTLTSTFDTYLYELKKSLEI